MEICRFVLEEGGDRRDEFLGWHRHQIEHLEVDIWHTPNPIRKKKCSFLEAYFYQNSRPKSGDQNSRPKSGVSIFPRCGALSLKVWMKSFEHVKFLGRSAFTSSSWKLIQWARDQLQIHNFEYGSFITYAHAGDLLKAGMRLEGINSYMHSGALQARVFAPSLTRSCLDG